MLAGFPKLTMTVILVIADAKGLPVWQPSAELAGRL
jgi:hypothetical protein